MPDLFLATPSQNQFKTPCPSTKRSHHVDQPYTSVNFSCLLVQLEELKAHIEDTTLQYPDYYTQKFHGYDGGNLDWEATWEVEVAAASLAMRIFKDDKITSEAASHELRKSFLDATQV